MPTTSIAPVEISCGNYCARDTFLFSPLEQSAARVSSFSSFLSGELENCESTRMNPPSRRNRFNHFYIAQSGQLLSPTALLFDCETIDQCKMLPELMTDLLPESAATINWVIRARSQREKWKSPRQIANWPINGARRREMSVISENYKDPNLEIECGPLLFSSDSTRTRLAGNYSKMIHPSGASLFYDACLVV